MISELGLYRLIDYARHGRGLNLNAIAFMMTEMRFRGPFIRSCEFLYACWHIYVLRRDPILTFGKCQVSFAYWRKRFGKNNLALLCAYNDERQNYEVCCDYLDANEQHDLEQLIVRFNGYPSFLYAHLFHKNLTRLCHVVKHPV